MEDLVRKSKRVFNECAGIGGNANKWVAFFNS